MIHLRLLTTLTCVQYTITFSIELFKTVYIVLQMNLPLRLNRTQEQWVDLGIHTEACMTRPETCGAAGGAVSLWVNLNECYYKRSGIVSSIAVSSSGFYIGCSPATLGYDADLCVQHGHLKRHLEEP